MLFDSKRLHYYKNGKINILKKPSSENLEVCWTMKDVKIKIKKQKLKN